MSSNPYSTIIQYNPVPARVWSRVQNPCSVIAYENNDPAANTDFSRADYERQMLLKGNVLQYKKNSSNLTKKQRYTQIAKGMWTNRTKTWATQSDTYSNPNMTSLLRVNYTTLDPSNNTFSNRSNPFGCPINEIQNGGNLVCNVVVDPCTQEVIKRTKSQQLCNPTSDSDVPGQIQQLCWNDGTQTWYPRQRYIMPTSGTKWPVGYKAFVSALTPAAPILTLDSVNADSITLSWTVINSQCIPISSFNIYQNNVLVENVLYPTNTITTTISNLCGTNTFNVTSLSSNIESESSNIISFSPELSVVITGGGSYTYDSSTNAYTAIFTTAGTIKLSCNVSNFQVIILGGGGGGAYSGDWKAGGGGGGGQAVIPFYTPNLSNLTFNVTQIGIGGFGVTSIGNGSSGTSTNFSDPNGTSYTVTGGGGGQISSVGISGNYNGPYTTSYGENITLYGSGGDGGQGTNGGAQTYGQNSYLKNQSYFLINSILLGGGGGGTGQTGGEGGSNQGSGVGGASSNSLNLNTQNAKGYGAGGGATFSFPPSGSGSNGVCIFYFQYP
jgi:hypothetical protein